MTEQVILTHGDGVAMEDQLEPAADRTWRPVSFYLLYGPPAGYLLVLAGEHPSGGDTVILVLGLFFAYALGFLPMWLAGFVTAVTIRLFRFWRRGAALKFMILGPILGASLSIPVGLLLFGERRGPLAFAILLGLLLGTEAYRRTLP